MKDVLILLLLLFLAIAVLGDDRDPRAAIEDTTLKVAAADTQKPAGPPACTGSIMPYVGPRVPATVRMRFT